jgi:integrase
VWSIAGRAGKALTLPVRRDQHGRWHFRTTVHKPDGTKTRISGWPGTPGPFHDLGRTQVGAQQAERRAISAVMTGKPLAVAAITATREAPTTKTIREHAVSFLATYKPAQKPSERREKRRVLNSHLLPFFGDLTIEGLTQTHVDTFAKAELDRGMAVKTVNNRLAVLSTMIKYVKGERSRLRFKLDGPIGEIKAVDSADVEKLLDPDVVENATYRVVILLAAEAGLRVGEIRGLQWTDIADDQVTVRRALDKQTNEAVAPKHNRVRKVPLSPRLLTSLAALPRRGLWVVTDASGEFVTYDRLSETVNEMYVRAEVVRPPKPVHCLRHTFGTVMARKVPLPVLRDLMGHADIGTTMRYIDVAEDDKRSAIAAVFGSSVAAARQQGNRR